MRNPTKSKISLLPAIDLVFLSVVSIAAVQCFRFEHFASPTLAWLDVAISMLLPLLLLGRLHRIDRQIALANSYRQRLVAGSVLFASLPVLVQFCIRPLGYGDSVEVIFLLVLQYAAWYLTVFSAWERFARGAFVLSSANVLVVTFMSGQNSISVLALIFFAGALWWLMGNYWNRVAAKAIDGESKTLPIRGYFAVGTIAALALVAIISWINGPVTSTAAVNGFMPTSGGNRWAGAYARSGLGDGDMLVGGEDATTTGAVDSDQFIEDSRPSMYDMISEQFEEPVITKKERVRAMALSGEAKHMHNVKQSEQSGKTFRTIRKPKNAKTDRSFEDRIAKALLYLEGSVPVRLALGTFNTFDGCDWTNQELKWDIRMNPLIQVQTVGEKPWYVVRNQERTFLRNYRCHKLKVMRLKSRSLPSPNFLKSWHIFKVDAPNLFDWGDDGLIKIDSSSVAAQTVIDIVSSVPNYYEMRSPENLFVNDQPSYFGKWVEFLSNVRNNESSKVQGDKIKAPLDQTPFTSIPNNDTKSRLLDLASEWTDGVPEGWSQVETIVDRIRNDFEVDNKNVPPDDCDDTVGFFLESGGGPNYLFATTATQMLRAAGYKTRLTSGLLVQKKDFVPSSNQSIATSENLHIWPEVCLEGWHWIPVEPTPGFPRPYNSMTWWQTALTAMGSVGKWIVANPISFLTILMLFGLAWGYRWAIFACICWLAWCLAAVVLPGQTLQVSRRLIDARFWCAGLPRPAFVPIADWYSRVGKDVGHEFFYIWNMANFCPSYDSSSSSLRTNQACRQIVSELSYGRIKEFVGKQREE